MRKTFFKDKSAVISLTFTIISIFTLLFSGLGVFAEEEEDNSLKITSKTTKVSADCIISGGNQEEDKKRTTIGVGETVTLELTGKRAKDISSVTWEVTSGGEWASVDGKKTTATLTAKQTPKTSGSVNVEANATLNNGEALCAIINFEVLVPSDIKARHSGSRKEGGGYPKDGKENRDIVGASSQLILIIQPLSVNFENIEIIEKAADKPGDVADWMGAHTPGTESRAPDSRHEIRHDEIGMLGGDIWNPCNQATPEGGRSTNWKCDWLTCAGGQDCCLIHEKPYLETFTMDRDGKDSTDRWHIKCTVSKFGCKVSRSTADGKHVDE